MEANINIYKEVRRSQLVGALETKLEKISENGKSFGSDHGSITVLR